MRVLVHSVFYKPEAIGNGTYTAELCEFLVRRGHQVRVVCPPPYYPHWRIQPGYSAARYSRETLEGVQVFRCPIYVPRHPGAFKRLLYGLSFALSSLPVMLRMASWRPAAVYVIEPNFFNTGNALLAARLSRALAWLQIQDFEIDIALALGVSKSPLTARLAHACEAFLMRRFDVLSTISLRMLQHLKSKAVDPARCRLFPNWVDTNLIYSQSPSPMRASLGLGPEKIVCLFSGTMGAKQGVEIVVDAARLLASNPRLAFIVCGDGGALSELKSRAAGLPNIRFLPLQPLSLLNDLLSVADIHLLPQKTTAQDLVMPSKLLGMAASGRPVVATVNPGTEVAAALASFGLVTPPGDVPAFARAIESLAGDTPERLRLAAAARQYALRFLSKDKILLRFESELSQLTGESL